MASSRVLESGPDGEDVNVAAPRGVAGPALPAGCMRAVAVDGKISRGARRADGTRVHLPGVAEHGWASSGPSRGGRQAQRDPRPKSTETPRKPDNITDPQKLLKLSQIIRVFADCI